MVTTPIMALAGLSEKDAEIDVLRQVVQFMAHRPSEIDVEGRCGAGVDEKALTVVSKVLKATWQRCRVHFMRYALACAPNSLRRMVSAAIASVFAQKTAKDAHAQWRVVTEQLRGKLDKIGTFMGGAGHEVHAYMDSPKAHWLQIHSGAADRRDQAAHERRGCLPRRHGHHPPGRRPAGAKRWLCLAATLHVA